MNDNVNPTITVGARLSTPEPLDIPRWESDTKPQYDFASYLQQPQPPPTPLTTPRSLAMPSLEYGATMRAQEAVARREAEAAAKKADADAAKMAAKFNTATGQMGVPTLGKASGSIIPKGKAGLSAYGVTKSGMANQRGTGIMGLQEPFSNALTAMFNDMKRAGLGKPGITDGWRSYATQVATKAKKGSLAATPGKSVHGIGMAADLALNSKQQAWMYKNAYKYGVYNLRSEPWHWQYYGGKGDGKAGEYITPADYGADGPQKGSAPNGLQPEMHSALQAANAELRAAGLPEVSVNSGYRTEAEQKRLQRIVPQQTTSYKDSAHSIGEAADLDGPKASLDFLRLIAPKVGLVPTDEEWHFQADPRAVTRWRR